VLSAVTKLQYKQQQVYEGRMITKDKLLSSNANFVFVCTKREEELLTCCSCNVIQKVRTLIIFNRNVRWISFYIGITLVDYITHNLFSTKTKRGKR